MNLVATSICSRAGEGRGRGGEGLVRVRGEMGKGQGPGRLCRVQGAGCRVLRSTYSPY